MKPDLTGRSLDIGNNQAKVKPLNNGLKHVWTGQKSYSFKTLQFYALCLFTHLRSHLVHIKI